MTPHDPIRPGKPPPVQLIHCLDAVTLRAIEDRAVQLAIRLRRLGVPEQQMLADVSALVRFVRRGKG